MCYFAVTTNHLLCTTLSRKQESSRSAGSLKNTPFVQVGSLRIAEALSGGMFGIVLNLYLSMSLW